MAEEPLARRMNYAKAAKEKKARENGSERIDGPGFAEEARAGYRETMNAPADGDPPSSPRATAVQARTRSQTEWKIVPTTPGRERRYRQHLRRHRKLAAKGAAK
jgi:hypothetical protein